MKLWQRNDLEASETMLQWLQRRRRDKLRRQPFPDAWRRILGANARHYCQLSEVEQAKLRGDIQVFVAEKHWEGCGGLIVTDEMKVTIAAQACLLVLAFEDEYYDAVQSILVYPNAYVAPGKTITRGGVVLEGESHREGEAWYRGPVILSWRDALAGGRQQHSGGNLVIHEFAHQLDMQNGRQVDGAPLLATASQYERWQHVMSEEFERLQQACSSGQHTLIDCYGATNLAEFFAVVSETFFEKPQEMVKRHTALYDILREYYGQNPAVRT